MPGIIKEQELGDIIRGFAFLGTVPDLMTLFSLDALEALTNADTEKDHNVAVFGMTAPENWLKTPKGYECWHHIPSKLGYIGP